MSIIQIVGRRENFSLGSLGKGIGGDVAGKSAKEAAEKAAKEKAAKEAAEKVAKEKAAKEAAEKASKEAAEKAAKEKAAKEAAEKASKEAAEKASKEAAEKAAKEAAEKAGKNYAIYAGAAAVVAGMGLYTYGKGADEAEESNNTPRGITSITSNTGTTYDVSYTPAIRILKDDSMVISSSKTTPTIDGLQVVSSVISDSQIVIDFGVKLTSEAAGGSIKVTTTPEDQVAADVAAAAAAAAEAAKDATKSIFSGILDTLGISGDTLKWIGIALGILCILGVAFMVLK
jgi:membrane protein involved in colicin uptake